MSCVLRAYGKIFEVDKFLQNSKLKPIAIWRKGEAKWKNKPERKCKDSGFSCDVSRKDFNNLKGQISDAVKFLKSNQSQLKKLVALSGVENVGLDFGIERRDAYVQFDCFPSELLLLAGKLGIDVALTQYPISKKRKSK